MRERAPTGWLMGLIVAGTGALLFQLGAARMALDGDLSALRIASTLTAGTMVGIGARLYF